MHIATYFVALLGYIATMSDISYKVHRQKLVVQERETRVRDAKQSMECGYIKLKAEFEREYERLKTEYERACIALDREKSVLEEVTEEAARGYSS